MQGILDKLTYAKGTRVRFTKNGEVKEGVISEDIYPLNEPCCNIKYPDNTYDIHIPVRSCEIVNK